MTTDWQQRTRLLMGEVNLQKLQSMHVLVVGLGGVGAYAAEELCRAGIGEMTIIDADIVEDTNRNRQLLALTSTIGKRKTDVMAERLLDINPEIKLHKIAEFIRDERTVEILKQSHYDYVVDAIDSLSPKVFLIYHALQQNLKIVSAMGAGGKTDPTLVQIADIKKSYQCRLAHAIRKRLHKMGIHSGFQVVFSPEIVQNESVIIDSEPEKNKLSTVGSISYMPAIFGCMAASVVIRDSLR
ncbi:MAG TPA: tRNA threonylcarbamoyladenosine dehydratase [Bacteroidales bacterium]|jgi:tRNA threonylcarbamoyladenosine dehydratase|nr:tRNA threonylcarbamoyladenosine dehydratase [Bacteroidales bacterium]HNW67688.1 tRNA threonylcarbamoyladenosine dehydratase [Bacteroidales bacterium]HPT52011.1 tRNA threonylcarbamoyladenosine dehydratase [Bacteroidales bacterium]